MAAEFSTRDRGHAFAGIPPLELVKLLIARAASTGDCAMIIDIKKAHLNGKLSGERRIRVFTSVHQHRHLCDYQAIAAICD